MKMARTWWGTWEGETGYYLPVMIGDVLHYIDKNCFWIDNWDWHKTRELLVLKEALYSLYYHFIRWHHLPLDSQNDSAVDYIYSLIS